MLYLASKTVAWIQTGTHCYRFFLLMLQVGAPPVQAAAPESVHPAAAEACPEDQVPHADCVGPDRRVRHQVSNKCQHRSVLDIHLLPNTASVSQHALPACAQGGRASDTIQSGHLGRGYGCSTHAQRLRLCCAERWACSRSMSSVQSGMCWQVFSRRTGPR